MISTRSRRSERCVPYPLLRRLADRIEHATDALDPLGQKLNSVLSAVPAPGTGRGRPVGYPAGTPCCTRLWWPCRWARGCRCRSWTWRVRTQRPAASSRSACSPRFRPPPPALRTGSPRTVARSVRVGPGARVAQLRRNRGVRAQLDAATQEATARAGVVTSTVGLSLISAAGWLGGHLAYAQGVGVDTTAFESFPAEWTDAVRRLRRPGRGHDVDAGCGCSRSARAGRRIDRCSGRPVHAPRSAPLHEGELRDGCVHCPLARQRVRPHRRFSACRDRQPRPQPALEARVRDGRVQVRRDEARALRNNIVGH